MRTRTNWSAPPITPVPTTRHRIRLERAAPSPRHPPGASLLPGGDHRTPPRHRRPGPPHPRPAAPLPPGRHRLRRRPAHRPLPRRPPREGCPERARRLRAHLGRDRPGDMADGPEIAAARSTSSRRIGTLLGRVNGSHSGSGNGSHSRVNYCRGWADRAVGSEVGLSLDRVSLADRRRDGDPTGILEAMTTAAE